MGGDVFASASISPNETVRRLKEELCQPQLSQPSEATTASTVAPQQLKLVHDATTLVDKATLADHKLLDDSDVTVIILPPIPDWAEELGLTGDHPTMLRDYYTKHSLKQAETWAHDAAVWETFAQARQKVAQSKAALGNWNHDIAIHLDGQPTSLLRAQPGEQLSVKACGRIWNKNGDSCIHQLMLVLDTVIVAELSDGVPGRGRNVSKNLVLEAPKEPGTYMLWKDGQLQYSMRDARRNCEASMEGSRHSKYPGQFIAWLVVE